MQSRPFNDKNNQPDEIGLEQVLGFKYDLYNHVLSDATGYKKKWNFSERNGWTLKVYDDKRVLFYLTPLHESFNLTLIIRRNEKVLLLEDNDLNEQKSIIKESKSYGKGFAMDFSISQEHDAIDLYGILYKIVEYRAGSTNRNVKLLLLIVSGLASILGFVGFFIPEDHSAPIESIKEQIETQYFNHVMTKDILVNQITLIQNIPERTVIYNPNNGNIDSTIWNCGDSIYWEIVQKGLDVLPHLITKMQDSTLSIVKSPCGEGYLTEGCLAFIIFEEILPIPYYLVFNIQFDFFDMSCTTHHPLGLLDYVNKHPYQVHLAIKEWYSTVQQLIEKQEIDSLLQNDCQKAFGINHIYQRSYK